jgi:quercetin dioxygenase-like cupin family protein
MQLFYARMRMRGITRAGRETYQHADAVPFRVGREQLAFDPGRDLFPFRLGPLGGSFSLWEAVFPPGAGAPPHTHTREDEAFYVLSGEILIEFEGDPAPRRISPGGFFFGARDRRHAVRNVSDQPARVLILSAPSCGLDQMFAELDAATAAGTPGTEKVAAITAKYGVFLEGGLS